VEENGLNIFQRAMNFVLTWFCAKFLYSTCVLQRPSDWARGARLVLTATYWVGVLTARVFCRDLADLLQGLR